MGKPQYILGFRSKRMQRTLDEVRREGLEALRERLGRADMIRFMQQFETGRAFIPSRPSATLRRTVPA